MARKTMSKKMYKKKVTTLKKKFIAYVKSRNTKNKVRVSAGLGFPKQMLMAHKYVEPLLLSAGAGSLQNFNYACLGMFDPRSAAGGHQPLYYDQMAALYDHYVVIGSKIIVTLVPTDQNYMATIILNDDPAVTATNWSTQVEQSNVTSALVLKNSTRPTKLVKKFSTKKTFPGSILAREELQGSPTTNPIENNQFTISIQAVDQITALGGVYGKVEVQYIALWFELKDVDQS